jgi:hypothetical protein
MSQGPPFHPSGALLALKLYHNLTIQPDTANAYQDAYDAPFPAELTIYQCIALHDLNTDNLIKAHRTPDPIAGPEKFIKNLKTFHPQFKDEYAFFERSFPNIGDRTWIAVSAYFSSSCAKVERTFASEKASASASAKLSNQQFSDNNNNSAATAARKPEFKPTASTYRDQPPKTTMHADIGPLPLDMSILETALRKEGYKLVKDTNNYRPNNTRQYQSSNKGGQSNRYQQHQSRERTHFRGSNAQAGRSYSARPSYPHQDHNATGADDVEEADYDYIDDSMQYAANVYDSSTQDDPYAQDDYDQEQA